MTESILSGILGCLFLVGAVMQYRCVGPLWTPEYIASSVKEKKKLKKRQSYYWAATGCLLIGLSFLLVMVYGLTGIPGFAYAVCVLVILLFILLVLGCIRAVRRGMDTGTDRAVHRRKLEEAFASDENTQPVRRKSYKRRKQSQSLNRKQSAKAFRSQRRK